MMDAEGGEKSRQILNKQHAGNQNFQQCGDEKIYEAVFDGVLADLDVFSRYSGAAEAKRTGRGEGFGELASASK